VTSRNTTTSRVTVRAAPSTIGRGKGNGTSRAWTAVTRMAVPLDGEAVGLSAIRRAGDRGKTPRGGGWTSVKSSRGSLDKD
jgi:hypothetical protein